MKHRASAVAKRWGTKCSKFAQALLLPWKWIYGNRLVGNGCLKVAEGDCKEEGEERTRG